jgi:hypothetical protein
MTKYTPEHIVEAIYRANTSEIATIFKGMISDTPSWSDFIALIDREANGSPMPGHPQAPLEERWVNGVVIRNLFYLTVRILDTAQIRQIQAVKDIFGPIFNAEIDPVGAFINIIGGEKPGEAHKDGRDTIFWQCQGESEWTIYNTPETERYDTSKLVVNKVIKLAPGDVLYLKKGGLHSVRNFGPRASIAFMPNK